MLFRTTVTVPALIVLATSCALFALHSSDSSADETSAAPPVARDGAFAVVELFTSEGCSSCPPADELLGEIADDAQKRGVSIFPIAFHVDYWDGLGWKDRFSLAAATDRQQRYAKTLGSEIYTPQMVVNGRTQFVGSDRDAYLRAVGAALATPSAVQLHLECKLKTAGDLSIGFTASNPPAGSVLNLVVVQRSATTKVPRGENSGRTLHHVNIARSIKTIPLDAASGEASLKLPGDLDVKDAMVVGFAQNADSMQIVAAGRVDAAH